MKAIRIDNDMTFELSNGNKVHFKKHPKWGYWTVNFDKGGTPRQLNGQYTSVLKLIDKTNAYLKSREKNPTEIIYDG